MKHVFNETCNIVFCKNQNKRYGNHLFGVLWSSCCVWQSSTFCRGEQRRRQLSQFRHWPNLAKFRTVLFVASIGVVIRVPWCLLEWWMCAPRHHAPRELQFQRGDDGVSCRDGHGCGGARHVQHVGNAYIHHRFRWSSSCSAELLFWRSSRLPATPHSLSTTCSTPTRRWASSSPYSCRWVSPSSSASSCNGFRVWFSPLIIKEPPALHGGNLRGIAFTVLAYFIFIQAWDSRHTSAGASKIWIAQNTKMLMFFIFLGSTVVMEFLHLLRVNVFKLVVLMGTSALAMAFAATTWSISSVCPSSQASTPIRSLSPIARATTRDSWWHRSWRVPKTPPLYLFDRHDHDYRHGDIQEGAQRDQDERRLEPSDEGDQIL